MTKCHELIPPKMFKDVISPADYKMFEKFYLNYFVDCNKAIKWCPSPGCDRAVYYPELTAVDVFCE